MWLRIGTIGRLLQTWIYLPVPEQVVNFLNCWGIISCNMQTHTQIYIYIYMYIYIDWMWTRLTGMNCHRPQTQSHYKSTVCEKVCQTPGVCDWYSELCCQNKTSACIHFSLHANFLYSSGKKCNQILLLGFNYQCGQLPRSYSTGDIWMNEYGTLVEW